MPRNCACPRCAGQTATRGGGDGGARNDQDARLERLERLGQLHEKGVLSDEEFAAEKAKAMGEDETSA